MKINDELKNTYQTLIEKGFTTKQIAEQCSKPWSTIKNHLRKSGLKTKHHKEPLNIKKEDLECLVNQGMSSYKIAEKLNSSNTNIRHWIKKFGLVKPEIPKETHCIKCKTPLKGNQRKYCSTQCHNNVMNSWHNSAGRQKEKGYSRKIKLIEYLGRVECNKCGYNKNLAVLNFHHINPKEKSFPLNQAKCASLSMKRLIEEAKKCEVLCANCHTALHHPQFNFK